MPDGPPGSVGRRLRDAVAAGADAHQVQRTLEVRLQFERRLLTGILRQDQHRVGQLVRVDSRRAQGDAAGHVILAVPLAEEFEGITLVESILGVVDDERTVVFEAGDDEAGGGLAQIAGRDSRAHDLASFSSRAPPPANRRQERRMSSESLESSTARASKMPPTQRATIPMERV